MRFEIHRSSRPVPARCRVAPPTGLSVTSGFHTVSALVPPCPTHGRYLGGRLLASCPGCMAVLHAATAAPVVALPTPRRELTTRPVAA